MGYCRALPKLRYTEFYCFIVHIICRLLFFLRNSLGFLFFHSVSTATSLYSIFHSLLLTPTVNYVVVHSFLGIMLDFWSQSILLAISKEIIIITRSPPPHTHTRLISSIFIFFKTFSDSAIHLQYSYF